MNFCLLFVLYYDYPYIGTLVINNQFSTGNEFVIFLFMLLVAEIHLIVSILLMLNYLNLFRHLSISF